MTLGRRNRPSRDVGLWLTVGFCAFVVVWTLAFLLIESAR